MGYIAIDLGTTNVKVATYNNSLQMEKWLSKPVKYIRHGNRVEFDAEAYVDSVLELLKRIIARHGETRLFERIVLTGQAESLVVLGENGSPIINAISWMDERSTKECEHLGKLFSSQEYYQKTGQLAILPTWPATKILWLKNNLGEMFARARHFVLLKDYVVYRLTGELCADCSIATFSSYFDILNKGYWDDMLEACGIYRKQLPELIEPCTRIGYVKKSIADSIGLDEHTLVNIGTLDNFSSMIGTGNVHEGDVTLSTGTVMALATMAKQPLPDDGAIALHYGFMPDTYVYLPVAESGGACLEWYRNSFMPECSYDEMNRMIKMGVKHPELIFLPYITGTNAPEFDSNATGMFYGIRDKHEPIDFALAIMEGGAHLLAKNVQAIEDMGIRVKRIISTGGGAKSDLLSGIYADVTGVPIEVPEDREAACLGAAIIGAVDRGVFRGFEDAAQKCVRMEKRFAPHQSEHIKRRRRQFELLYQAGLDAARIE